MTKSISSAAVRRAWRTGTEIALLDVRAEGPFSLAHPFFAVSLPYPELTARILDLVPRRTAPVVVYDDGEGFAARAAATLEGLGYRDVAVLEGGLAAYRAAGEVFRDVNVPSKAFGELVESICHTPSLSPEEVEAALARPDTVVLDARRFEEFRTMSIPGGRSVPGGELVLRIADLAPPEGGLVIINCAGRTRSIIGTQSLVNAGLAPRVAALRNGTIGWTLSGRTLAHGETRRFSATSEGGATRARAAAASWAERVGVRLLDRAAYAEWLEDEDRTLYCLDVRTPEEFAAGHPAGFRSAPGGQLVQATDEWVGVRGARLALFDDDGVRARMTASWLKQMGWEVGVLSPGMLASEEAGTTPPVRPPLPDVPTIEAEALQARRGEVGIVDFGPSPQYVSGHIPGAHFLAPTRLAADLARVPGEGALVLVSQDGYVAAQAVAEASGLTRRPVLALAGGLAAWRAAELPIEVGSTSLVSPPDDVYRRPYEGTENPTAAMQAYIDWELQLVAQLANDGVSNFRVIKP